MFAFLAFTGFASVYMMRVNLSVAIVDMVRSKNTDTKSLFSVPFEGNQSGDGDDQRCDGRIDPGGHQVTSFS